MKFTRRAVIDVGTNSVKLLVGDVSGQKVHPVREDSEQTRLGRGFYQTHILQKTAITETAAAVARFAGEARNLDAASIRVIATSAARDAKNPQDLLHSIEKASSLPVEIISGEQEADWAFRGVISNADLARHPLLILDVGGGSTEFILGENGHSLFRQSFNIGTVRLMEQLRASDPPTEGELDDCRAWLAHFLAEQVSPRLHPALARCSEKQIQLVGTGGTSTILARIQQAMETWDREKIESAELAERELHILTNRLWRLPLRERQKIAGLPPQRADVILFGIVVYEAVMAEFSLSTLRVSTRGLRYAALMD